MPEGELWSTLVTAIDPTNIKAMPAVLQSTIDLLEAELVKARAALQEIQPNAAPVTMLSDEVTVGAMAAYRKNLIGRAPDFYYGANRLTQKDLGLVPTAVYEVQTDDEHALLEQSQYILPRRTSLLDIFSNSLILDHMAPYLSISSLLALASTSRFLHFMIMETPYVFRLLDLTRCRGAQLPAPVNPGGQGSPSEQLDELITEDEFYSAPLRSVFANLERRCILQGVRTLVLDGLSAPANLVSEIVLSDRFNVSILSIRGCLHLNERILMQTLQHAVRPTRPKGMPRVKGIYFFTPTSSSRGPGRNRYRDWWSSQLGSSRDAGRIPSEEQNITTSSQWQQNEWYRPSGRLFKRAIEDGWAQTLRKCEGIISFDAVLCRGPRHNIDLFSPANKDGPRPEGRFLEPAIATVALGPRGCDGCHSSPEGPVIWGQSPDEHFPLLSPLPLHSSTVTAAKRPALFPGEHPVLIARCAECLTDRWCHRCNKWFCASCLPHPERIRVNLSPHQTAVRAPRNNQNGDSGSSQERKVGI